MMVRLLVGVVLFAALVFCEFGAGSEIDERGGSAVNQFCCHEKVSAGELFELVEGGGRRQNDFSSLGCGWGGKARRSFLTRWSPDID